LASASTAASAVRIASRPAARSPCRALRRPAIAQVSDDEVLHRLVARERIVVVGGEEHQVGQRHSRSTATAREAAVDDSTAIPRNPEKLKLA
jgi:hypothetical protein